MALKFNKSKLQSFKNFQKEGNPPVTKIVLHHIAARSMTVEQIHNIHLKNGWAGIGYHFYIRKDGTIYEGRPLEYIGSHCLGQNSISIGVALEGDFRYEKPTDKQITAAKQVIKDIIKVYPKIKRVYNHKDLYPTACPVVNLKEMVTGNSKGELTNV